VVLLAVDQELGEGATLRVAQNSPIRSGRSKVGEHQDVEQRGAGSRHEGGQALTELSLELVGTHGTETTQSRGLQSAEVAPQGDRPAVRLPRRGKARPMIEPGHGRRPLAFRRTRLAQRPIACNAADPYHLGDEPYPPKGALSRGGSAQ